MTAIFNLYNNRQPTTNNGPTVSVYYRHAGLYFKDVVITIFQLAGVMYLFNLG